MRARAGRAASAPGAIARLSRRIDILCPLRRRPSVAENGKRTPTARATDPTSLAEARARTQVRDFATEMSAKLTILIGVLAVWASPAAAQSCQTAITDFRFVVDTETSMGHVKQDRQAAALAELGRIQQACSAGRNAEALAALHALQRRMGFR